MVWLKKKKKDNAKQSRHFLSGWGEESEHDAEAVIHVRESGVCAFSVYHFCLWLLLMPFLLSVFSALFSRFPLCV